MSELPSRRTAMASAATLLCGFARGADPAPPPRPIDPPIVDTHFHLVHPRLPGMPEGAAPDEAAPLAPFGDNQRKRRLELAAVIEARLNEAGVVAALCMPRSEVSGRDPLGIREIEATAPLVRAAKLHPVGFVNPERFDRDHLARVEAVLSRGRVKALKVFLGYFPYGPDHVGYRRYYPLAAKYKVPVILHTGDPYSRTAKLRYTDPLAVDDVATDYPDVRFVLAHFGNPWLPTAAEVVFKNPNVWADLSAFLIGDAAAFAKMDRDGVTERTARRVREWVEYTEKPDRFLFGSDWPLAPVKVYRDLVRKMVPAGHHAAVFRDNARSLFGV